jgi:enoyl-CoA hydratase/carnithine racemase
MANNTMETVQPVLFETLATINGYAIGVITLNAEKTLNALSLEMIDLITEQLLAWSNDEHIAVVILQAAGEKAFCAGGDLQNLYQSMLTHHASADKDDIRTNYYARDFFEREYRLDYLIHTYPKPILCWGHGIVMGGGMGLMAGASHRVVTEKSRLAMPEIAIGLFPDVGGSYFLSRMPGKLGLFLALTGAMINAADARFISLADYVISQADKAQVFDVLLKQPWTHLPTKNGFLLDAVLNNAQTCSATGLDSLSAGPIETQLATIQTLCSQDSLDYIIESLINHNSDDKWLSKATASVKNGSPSAIHLANLLLNQARDMSLADVFRMEYLAALHCAARPDFAEGIRALLIDKDLKPHWQPATHSEITPDWINSFIESPWPADQHPLADLGNHH